MERYADNNNNSGVAGYDLGPDYIRVQFKDGAIYLYTDASAGRQNISQMKSLAMQGDGLNAYINRHVSKLYARKER